MHRPRSRYIPWTQIKVRAGIIQFRQLASELTYKWRIIVTHMSNGRQQDNRPADAVTWRENSELLPITLAQSKHGGSTELRGIAATPVAILVRTLPVLTAILLVGSVCLHHHVRPIRASQTLTIVVPRVRVGPSPPIQHTNARVQRLPSVTQTLELTGYPLPHTVSDSPSGWLAGRQYYLVINRLPYPSVYSAGIG